MFLLEFAQYNRISKVGVFENEEDIIDFLEKIPFVKRTDDVIDGMEISYYSIEYKDIPEYYDMELGNVKTILARQSFAENEVIEISWEEIENFSRAQREDNIRYAVGSVRVDSYNVPIVDAKEYICLRNEMLEEIRKYYKQRGYESKRTFAGSEDGEAIAAIDSKGEMKGFVYLDPEAMAEYVEGNLNKFIEETTGI